MEPRGPAGELHDPLTSLDSAGVADEERVRRFAAQLVGVYTGSVLTPLIDVGHRTGLFETLAAGCGTSDEIARRAGLQERYVREWLGAMAASSIVEYDAASRAYTLPADHAAVLTGATVRNMAPFSRLVGSLGTHVDALTRSFREGGGIPYSSFRPAFTDAMDEAWRRIYDDALVNGFLTVDPEVPARLRAGCRAADIGCGTGHAIHVMAAAFPQSTFSGFDIGADAIERAQREARELGLRNATFGVADVAHLTSEVPYDIVFAFDAVHDQVDPAGVLRHVHDALAPDGVFFIVDFKFSSNLEDNVGNPFGALYYGISTMHCMTVSLAEGGAGLGTVWGTQLATRMLAEAGFRDVTVHDAPRPQNCVYVCRK